MVTLEGLIYCSPQCVWAYGCGDPNQAVVYAPDGFEQLCCQWCAGCGSRLSPHLGVAGCIVHGERCYGIDRWFLRTKAAIDFCRLVWIRTGEVLELSSPLWARAMEVWRDDSFAGADGLEIFERVMAEL
jgi:hypothetical protein